MKQITFPLKLRMSRREVADLQQGLTSLGLAIPAAEAGAHRFGVGTRDVVRKFQAEHGLTATGWVDEATARLLNELLAKLGVLEATVIHEVFGKVRTATRPATGFQVCAYDRDTSSEQFLGSSVTDRQGAYSIRFEEVQFKRSDAERGGPDVFIRVFDSGGQALGQSQIVKDAPLKVKLDIEVALPPATNNADGHREVPAPLGPGAEGDAVATLQVNLLQLGSVIPANEQACRLFGAGTQAAVLKLQLRAGLPLTGLADEATLAALGVAMAAARTSGRRVEGRIYFENGRPAPDIAVRLYDRRFGEAPVMVRETRTDAHGFYAIPYVETGLPANLEVRTVGRDGQEISLSAPKYQAAKHEILNLVAPLTVALGQTEYRRLCHDLEPHVGTIDNLKHVCEDDKRQDLRLLYRATGWDARLLALVATAQALASQTGMEPAVLYALFRVGLPTNPQSLAQVAWDTINQALHKARTVGIVELNDDDLKAVQASFTAFVRNRRLESRPPGGAFSIADALKLAGLNGDEQLGDEKYGNEQQRFVDLLFAHGDDPETLWRMAGTAIAEGGAGLEEGQIKTLKLHGKLAFLTSNNLSVLQELQALLQPDGHDADPLDRLVDAGLYRASAWEDLLNRAARRSGKPLQEVLPPSFDGKPIDKQLYAVNLARKVRLAFPTHVAAQMLAHGELCLGTDHDIKRTAQFLWKAAQVGFRLGRVGVEQFVAHYQELFDDGDTAQMRQSITSSVKLLQRLWQISPHVEITQVLVDNGIRSAFDVVAYSRDEFVARFGPKFASLEIVSLVYGKDEFVARFGAKVASQKVANLVYGKAEQVTITLYTFYSTALQANSNPGTFATSGTASQDQQTREHLHQALRHLPNMESLFGSLDFCECPQCRSVLSPAAYLVDLLKFLDLDPKDWERFTTNWLDTHQVPYPFRDADAWNAFSNDWSSRYPGKAVPANKSPYEVLVDRRPDLPHLLLTCENTNTELPHIDLVNEILEYWVDVGQLEGATAHNTDHTSSADLLAEPQNIRTGAYDKLLQERYPLFLPFDLWIETTRRFFNQFNTPLWQVAEIFRPTDELRATQPPPNPSPVYYREAVFAESLGLAPADYKLLTDPDTAPHWYTLYGCGATTEALTVLNSAKTLSRRLGVTYQELVDLVRTGFVNPELGKLVLLRKLDVDVSDVFRYKNAPGYPPLSTEERVVFDQHLTEVKTRYQFDAQAWIDEVWGNNGFARVLILHDVDTGCNFEATTLRHAGGIAAQPIDFLRLNLFVRLWRKLGWTMEETDQALQVFIPTALCPLTEANIGEALRTALMYLAHLQTLVNQLQLGETARLRLLPLWSALPTTGHNPLYEQLFLIPSILKDDAAFDYPLGQYLTADASLQAHLPALRAAFNLTSDDIDQILKAEEQSLVAEGQSLDEAKRALSNLTLANVSRLYRYNLLARALKLTIPDLIALRELTGLNPFAELSTQPISAMANDILFSQALRFVDAIQAMRDSGFTVEDLNYLLRHRYDPVGKYRPDKDAQLVLIQKLAAEIRRIRSDYAVPADPLAFTDERLQQVLALALPVDVASAFLMMWQGTLKFEAALQVVAVTDQLNPQEFTIEPGIQVSYDSNSSMQHLTYRRVLVQSEKDRLLAAYPGHPVLRLLLDDVQAQGATFRAGYEPYLSAFQMSADFDTLFSPPVPTSATEEQQSRQRKQRSKLAQAFLPYLQDQLIRRFVVQALGALGDPLVIESLLTSSTLLADQNWPGQALLEAFAGAAQSGLTVTFIDGAGQTLASETATTANTAQLAADKRAGATHARFSGYFAVPASGAYHFTAEASKAGNVTAELRLVAFPNPILSGAAEAGHSIKGLVEVELKAGRWYEFTFDASLSGADVTLQVASDTLPTDELSILALIPWATVERINRAYGLLSKALQLLRGLTEREIRYLATSPAGAVHFDLSHLPAATADATNANASQLFAQFWQLARYLKLRHDLAGDRDDWIDVFLHARRTYPASANGSQACAEVLADLHQRLADLTRRKFETIASVVEALGFGTTSHTQDDILVVEAPRFTQGEDLTRLWQALQVMEKLGLPAEQLVRASQILSPDLVEGAGYAIACNVRAMIKARYEPKNWQQIARSLFDPLRQRQREALVAYVLRHHPEGFENANQLFEYFLIDPGMEPVVKTSRIRLALSSVQLFIQRCLLNLEPQVHPSAIKAEHWQWMKRYRVWEANRKIFLYPENWLEPEFRDDKTHLFRDLEGVLLQGDPTNDMVEDAFLDYLHKLDEIARLEIAAMYCQEDILHPAATTLHVFGRTYGEPHKYFYRRYTSGEWTPWEPVGVEIEGDHLVPVVWHDRLHLFWLTFLERADDNENLLGILLDHAGGFLAMLPEKLRPSKWLDVQLNWSEYFRGEWKTRRSSGLAVRARVDADAKDVTATVSVHVTKDIDADGQDRAVIFHLTSYYLRGQKTAFKLVSRHGRPEIVEAGPLPLSPYTPADEAQEATDLTVTYISHSVTVDGEPEKPADTDLLPKKLLRPIAPYSLLFSVNATTYPNKELAVLVNPFFLQDAQHTFYIEPWLEETTIDKYESYLITPTQPEPLSEDWWKHIPVVVEVPYVPEWTDPGGPVETPWEELIDVLARFGPQERVDWLTNDRTLLSFSDKWIGREGGMDLVAITGDESAGTKVSISAASDLKAAGIMSVIDVNSGGEKATARVSGVKALAGGTQINVIAGNGFDQQKLDCLAASFNATAKSNGNG